MGTKGNKALLAIGSVLLVVALLSGFALFVTTFPQSLFGYGYGLSSSIYRMSGGL